MPRLRKRLYNIRRRIARHGRIISASVLSLILIIEIAYLTPQLITLLTTWLETGSPNKTRWDYVKDIILPLLSGGLVIFVVWYLEAKSAQRREKIRIEIENIQASQRIEAEKAEALQRYLDRISTILLDYQVISLSQSAKRLGESYRDPRVESARDVIRARTLSILRYFSQDLEKKTTVIRLLIETRILEELGVSLSGADLTGINLIGVSLRGIRFNGVDLREADLRGVSSLKAQLIGSDLSGADLSSADLSEANLLGANLRGTNLRGVKYTMANLSEANLNTADLREADLLGSNLSGADLSGADLSGANLFGANLSSTNLSLANLISTDLRGADLRGADLSVAKLQKANLLGADLSGANLCGTSLSSADLTGTNLVRADMKGVRWNPATVWPARKCFEAARNIPEDLKRKLGL
jgi:uncharacterized protein YjbI with pentapeptide repeats